MDTIKKFTADLMKKIRGNIDSGDVKQLNEIAANIMVGASMVVMMLIMLVCLMLNEVGVFTVDKQLMRIAVILGLLVEIPPTAINSKCRGDKKGLKYWLLAGLIAMCIILTAALGHNVAIMIVFPVIISCRYYDEKLTGWVSVLTAVLFLGAGVFNAFFGILNLNAYKGIAGDVYTVTTNIRDAVMAQGIDRGLYIKQFLINELLPKYLQYSVVCIACSQIAVRGRRLLEIQAEVSNRTSRLEVEMNLATEIQASMLPRSFPAFPDHVQLDIFARNIPAKEVGGDFYDYFSLDDDHIALVMADVAGKGVGAALFMTVSKLVIKNQLQAGKSIGEAIEIANARLCENNETGLFVTVWACVYEVSTGSLRFVNAGHNPPIICRRDGKIEYLKERSGLVVAVLEDIDYIEYNIRLDRGEELFLYTDGVTEATDNANRLYGEDRLMNCVSKNRQLAAREQVDSLLKDIDDFVKEAPQADDITILAMKVN